MVEPYWRAALARLDGAYAERTIRSYRSDLSVYSRWCAEAGLAPFGEGRKTTEAVVRFLEVGMAGLAPATIKRRLAAIRTACGLLGLDAALTHEAVKLAIRRALRRNGRRPTQALGLTAELRDTLIAACPPTLRGARDRALIAVGYDVLGRRAELVGLLAEDLQRAGRGARILIREAKTDQLREGRFAYISAGALRRLDAWLAAAQIDAGPLFRPVLNGRALSRPMHPCGVNRALKAAASRAGLDAETVRALSGHSMRVGAAQDLVVAGRSVVQIMTAGRWRSVATLASYVQAAELNLWESEP